MQIVTSTNARHGMKVMRGPDWDYGAQDESSVYGVIQGFRNSRGGCRVIWIDEHDRIINENTYQISRQENDGRAELAIFEEGVSETLRQIEENGEQRCVLAETIEDTWNNAIELCTDMIIDSFTDHDDLPTIVEKFSNQKRKEKIIETI